ncbi:MAG: hypothetical protein MPK03_07220 [Alphaproteobacteria bacterium]|nr:hypothetical protein [Alphaproteobacteria bacterium]
MEEHPEEHRPSPPRDAWLLFVLQAAIAVAFAWFIAQIAGLARLTLFEFGITDWILALPVVVLILLGYGAALAALGRAAAYDEKRRLRSCYWPQAVAGLMWSVLIALFTAAAPFYGEEPGAREIFRQVLIFIPVFLVFSVFLFFVLMRGPRWD